MTTASPRSVLFQDILGEEYRRPSPPHDHRCKKWCTKHGPADHAMALMGMNSPKQGAVFDESEEYFTTMKELKQGEKAALLILQTRVAARAFCRTIVRGVFSSAWQKILTRQRQREMEQEMGRQWDQGGRYATVRLWKKQQEIKSIVLETIDLALEECRKREVHRRKENERKENEKKEAARIAKSPRLTQLNLMKMNPQYQTSPAKVLSFEKKLTKRF